MARRKKAKKAEAVKFDLTPMIDVTFQLLIFFIVVMKFKQIEETQSANLPQDEGFAQPTDAPLKAQLTLRLKWQNGVMVYDVCMEQQPNGMKQVTGGTLGDLIADRQGRTGYQSTFKELVAAIEEVYARIPKAEKIEISYNEPQTGRSSRQDPGQTAPWGFVTLALDAATKVNKNIFERTQDEEKKLSVVFKYTQPQGEVRVTGS